MDLFIFRVEWINLKSLSNFDSSLSIVISVITRLEYLMVIIQFKDRETDSHQTKGFPCNPLTVLTTDFSKNIHKVFSLFEFQVFLQAPGNHLHFWLQIPTHKKCYYHAATSRYNIKCCSCRR